MNMLKNARHAAGLSFVVGKIIIPTALFSGVVILATYTSFFREVLGDQMNAFLLTVFAIVGILFCIVSPIAYIAAKNNKKLVRNELKDFMSTNENVLEMYQGYLADARQHAKDFVANRQNSLQSILIECNQKTVAEIETGIQNGIAQLQNIIDSSTPREMARHQEYFLSVNITIRKLEDLQAGVSKLIPTEMSVDSYRILREKTQESFESQVQAHEKYATVLRNTIGILQREINEARHFLE